MASGATGSGTRRLASLDALRGFDMLWILYPTYPLLHTLLVALGLKGCWLDLQMEHPDWIGFTFYDTIYPLFLFLSGVSFPFSYAGSRARGRSTASISWKIVRRMVVLVLLGSTIFGSLKLDPAHLTLCSVIGRIGITCGLASFVYMSCGPRLRLAVCAGILLAYWWLPFLVACPGAAPGAAPYADRASCLYIWIEDNAIPRPLCGGGFCGLFPMVATALLGMFAGDWLRSGRDGAAKVRGLLSGAFACTALGVLAAGAFGRWSVPVIKYIWTSSFALVSAGYSFALLALFYWIIDVKGAARWSFPLKVVGMNAVFAYCASRTVFPWPAEMQFLFGGLMSFFPAGWDAFVGEAGYVVVYWLLLYLMYRKGIFLRA